MISGEQFRAARAILRLEQSALADAAGVSVESIKRLEGYVGEVTGRHETARTVQRTLEGMGVVFIEEDAPSAKGGAGVRLAESNAIARWNGTVDTILDTLVESLEDALQERGLESDQIAEAIGEARKEAYAQLERDIRDENTSDMIDALYQQDYEGLFKGDAGSSERLPGEDRNQWLARLSNEGIPAPKSKRTNGPRRISEKDIVKRISGDDE